VPNNLPFDLNTGPVSKEQVPVKEENTVNISINIEARPQRVNLREIHKNKILVSQSDIKWFYHRMEERDHCPRKGYELKILRRYKEPTTEAQEKGCYFETLCLGSSAGGKATFDLPRKKLTSKQVTEGLKKGIPLQDVKGDKTIDQIRIEEQALRFQQRIVELGVHVGPDNTQVPIIKHIFDNVYLIGELDIFPAVIKTPEGIRKAMIDLKLTGDIRSTFGEYGWGNFEYMDHIQAFCYHELITDIDLDLNPHLGEIFGKNPMLASDLAKGMYEFYYWVFGYKKADPDQENIFRVTYNATKRAELYQQIRAYVALTQMYVEAEKKGILQTNSQYVHCKDCPVSSLVSGGYCTDVNTVRSV